MKLIEKIINELLDIDKSIISPLLKTKVLASKLQNKILLDWVSNELTGYDTSGELPDYRKYTGNITGTYINGQIQYDNQPIPIVGLKRELEEKLRSMDFHQSISGIETLKGENKSGILEQPFPAELTGIIEQNWRKMGNPHLQLVNCKKTISCNAVVEILAFVRNTLLDFMLKIDSEFGDITEIEELKTKKEEISTIMNHTIINNTGNNNVLNTGGKAKITSTINISKGSKKELAQHLQDIGLTHHDTTELIEIIDAEEPNVKNNTFGQKVNSWTQKMLGKALDGSWNIGIGTAGNLISEAIKNYYGI
jgi:6-pyruvoyl-tetrahydropterin synthase